MTNKRNFKKYADEIGASVINEMMVAYYNAEGADRKAIADAVGKVLGAIEDAKNKANTFFGRDTKSFEDHKAYAVAKRNFFRALFNNIETEFSEKVNEAVKQFNAALPAEYKEAQKAAVAE